MAVVPIARDNSGMTALMIAAQENAVQCASLLIARNADTSIKDSDGMTALDHAEKAKSAKIARMLKGE